MGVACGACHVLRTNLLKPDLCELSNCRDEPQVVSDAAPFLNEKSLVQMECVCLSQIVIVHFGIIWESVDIIEAARILYDRKHGFLL
jgi:hypothetical protein